MARNKKRKPGSKQREERKAAELARPSKKVKLAKPAASDDEQDHSYEPTLNLSDDDNDDYLPFARSDAPATESPIVGAVINREEPPAAAAAATTDTHEAPPTLATGLKLCDLSPSDQELQFRYWHIRDPQAYVRCLRCAAEGHAAIACPGRRCSHCGLVDQHMSYACPQYMRCSKCRARGHKPSTCTAAYTRPPSAQDPCDHCGSATHIEEVCPRLGRIFDRTINPKKIPNSQMRRACYNCASDKHWGGDCPKLSAEERERIEGPGRFWTAEYAAHFIEDDAPRIEQSDTGSAPARVSGTNGAAALSTGSTGSQYHQLSQLNDMRDY